MLGRLYEPDDRDQNYLMRAVLPPTSPGITYRYWWPSGAWLDQGNTGTCVGHAWAHWIEDGPITFDGAADPYLIYREACKRDVWSGNDNGDLNFGTSVRAAAKYLKETGKVQEYRWAWDLGTVVQALLTTGPVVVGTNWYTGMFRPDDKGLIKIGGSVEGGHAYLLNGVNTDRELVRIKNSWSRTWGKNGYAYISFSDLDRLIREQGEACLAIEQ